MIEYPEVDSRIKSPEFTVGQMVRLKTGELRRPVSDPFDVDLVGGMTYRVQELPTPVEPRILIQRETLGGMPGKSDEPFYVMQIK